MILTDKARDSVEWIKIQCRAMKFIDSEFGPDKRYLAAAIQHITSGLGCVLSARTPQERAKAMLYGPPPLTLSTCGHVWN